MSCFQSCFQEIPTDAKWHQNPKRSVLFTFCALKIVNKESDRRSLTRQLDSEFAFASQLFESAWASWASGGLTQNWDGRSGRYFKTEASQINIPVWRYRSLSLIVWLFSASKTEYSGFFFYLLAFFISCCRKIRQSSAWQQTRRHSTQFLSTRGKSTLLRLSFNGCFLDFEE